MRQSRCSTVWSSSKILGRKDYCRLDMFFPFFAHCISDMCMRMSERYMLTTLHMYYSDHEVYYNLTQPNVRGEAILYFRERIWNRAFIWNESHSACLAVQATIKNIWFAVCLAHPRLKVNFIKDPRQATSRISSQVSTPMYARCCLFYYWVGLGWRH